MIKRKLRFLMQGLIVLVGFVVVPYATAETLTIFVGAGLRQPMDRLVQTFEDRTGHRVFIEYGGSGQLLARIQATGKGDLYIPGALFYIERLEKAGKIRSFRPMVQHTPVIGVNANQAGRITAFADLAKPGIRLAMGDPKAMAFGRTALAICEKSGRKESIDKNVVVYGATVKQLAMYVTQGVVDAAIIGRSDAFQNREKIVMVDIPKAYFRTEIIAAAVLRSTTDPHLAQGLCDFLITPDAVAVFQGHGFLPISE